MCDGVSVCASYIRCAYTEDVCAVYSFTPDTVYALFSQIISLVYVSVRVTESVSVRVTREVPTDLKKKQLKEYFCLTPDRQWSFKFGGGGRITPPADSLRWFAGIFMWHTHTIYLPYTLYK